MRCPIEPSPIPIEQRAAAFNHLDPAAAEGVQEFLGDLRRSCPVAHSAANGGFYLVTRYADVVEAATDASRFSARVQDLGAVDLLPGLAIPTAVVLFEQDPPEHAAWRHPMSAFFTPAAVAELEPYIRSTVRTLLADLVPFGSADLVADLAVRVPPLVVAALLGVPVAQREELAVLTRAYFSAAESTEHARRRAVAFSEFLRDQIRGRRGHAGADVLTWVVNAEIDGRRLTEAEALKHAMVMVAAGYLTASDALANLLLQVAIDPALRARVLADSTVIPAVIEESLRHESAVAATARTVLKPTTLGGVDLDTGDRVLLLWTSANRDDRKFDHPELFVPDRPGGRRHVAWGAGAHRCVGMHLARLELTVVLTEILSVIPDYRLAADVTVRRTFGVTRGLPALPVTWAV